MNARSNVVILAGGGLKSAVLAAQCLGKGNLLFVHVNYGQRSAVPEVHALRALAEHFGATPPLELETLHALQLQQRLAHAEASRAAAISGVVGTNALSPATLRGMFPVLLSLGAQTAWRIGATQLLTGVSRLTENGHLGLPGPETHPDYLREFLQDLSLSTETFGLRTPVTVEAPLINYTYEELARLALHFDIPLELAWSCLGAGPAQCGLCSGCITRERALAGAEAVHA